MIFSDEITHEIDVCRAEARPVVLLTPLLMRSDVGELVNHHPSLHWRTQAEHGRSVAFKTSLSDGPGVNVVRPRLPERTTWHSTVDREDPHIREVVSDG